MPLTPQSQAAQRLRPIAIVLCTALTGLATVRALGMRGVRVVALVFEAGDPVTHSRFVSKVVPCGDVRDSAALVAVLLEQVKEATEADCRPVVFPTSDAHALLLAAHAQALAPLCRIWTTPLSDLSGLVCKNTLYANAARAGVPLIPFLGDASAAQVSEWSESHLPPYLLKPIYQSAATSLLGEKNRVVATRAMLLDHVNAHGTSDLIIQELIAGGDGEIYDTYGLCNAEGKPVVMATHRRIRQSRPDFGTTCYGRIPSGLDAPEDRMMCDLTEQLLAASRFHGIFGIEWLRERATGKFYLIDFNARPFLSIGHLFDCGLNLPYLAYLDLLGETPSDLDPRPQLQARHWMDALRDLRTLRLRTGANALSLPQWMLNAVSASSSAYWSWRDPLPGLIRMRDFLGVCWNFVLNRLPVERAKGIEPSS